MVTNLLENHFNNFLQRLVYQIFLWSPDFNNSCISTELSWWCFFLSTRVGKPSPSSSRSVVIEKDGSIYELVFSRDFGVRRKRLKEKEPSVLFLKNTFYQNHHVFLKHAQDNLPGNLRSSGCERCKARSLSASPSVSLWWPSPLCRVALGYLSSAIPSEGKTLRPDSGALESEEMGPFSMELLPFSHFWHFEMWSLTPCNYLKPNHIVWWRLIIRSFKATDLVRTVMGMRSKDFSFLVSSFWSACWLMFSVHLSPKGIVSNALYTVKSVDWMDCFMSR